MNLDETDWKKQQNRAYRSDEESGGGLVEDDEGETAAEMADDVARRVWGPVTEGLVSFDDENHLVRRFG